MIGDLIWLVLSLLRLLQSSMIINLLELLGWTILVCTLSCCGIYCLRYFIINWSQTSSFVCNFASWLLILAVVYFAVVLRWFIVISSWRCIITNCNRTTLRINCGVIIEDSWLVWNLLILLLNLLLLMRYGCGRIH